LPLHSNLAKQKFDTDEYLIHVLSRDYTKGSEKM